jgi:uncharacterized lipoprotein YajG
MTRYFTSRQLMRGLPMLASSLVLAACAINPADAQNATPARTVQARQACATTMGLSPADSDYQMCVQSLLQTIASMDQPTLAARDRTACAQQGLQPGTRKFGECVGDAGQVASN